MVSWRGLVKFFTLFLVLSLFLAACERPLQQTNGNETAEVEETPAGEEAEGIQPPSDEDADAGYPPADGEEAAVDDGEPAPAEEDAGAGEPAGDDVDEGEPAAAEEDAEAGEPAGEDGDDGEPAAAEEDAGAGEDGDEGEPAAAEEDAGTGEPPAAEEETAEEDTAADEPAEEAAEEMAEEAAESESAEGAAAEETAAEAETTEADVADGQTHTVQAGENLYRIGLEYGVSWVVLARYNRLPNPNAIYAGQVLQIPPLDGDDGGDDGSAPTPTPSPSTETTYIVKAGDNLYKIGTEFGISWVQIAEANGIVNPNRILVGQELKIPTDTPGPTPEFTHVVQPGETLFSISLRYGVPWTDIAEANDIDSPHVIYPGQTLVIPGGNGES